jgi:hypothetical protein
MSEIAFADLAPATRRDPLAPAHVADFVGWLLAPAAANVTGQVFVVSGQTIQWLRGWSVRRDTLPANGSQPPVHTLFADEDTENIPGPISALFTHPETTGGRSAVH